MTQPKRLIEISLPLAKISEQSAREKSIRHGHISTLHIWWARRPLAAMRAAIFAALVPAPTDEAERKRLESLIETIVDWDQVKDGNSEAIEEARRLIQQAFPGGPPRLLDPFMGGGATGLEALRLGCETHAVELNPVAHLIELCTLVYPQKYGRGAGVQRGRGEKPKQMALPGQEQPEQLELFGGQQLALSEVKGAMVGGPSLAADVRRWGEWVLERAKAEIGHLYTNPAGSETIVGYLWARTVTCPNPACRAEMPLVRQWWLAQTGTRRLALKPVVDRVAKRVSFEVVEVNSQLTGTNNTLDPNTGTISQGNATCLVCAQVAGVDYIRAEGLAGRMGEIPMAVISNQVNGGKSYRPFGEQDKLLFQQASNLLAKVQDKVPDEPIPSTELRRISMPIYGLY